MGFFFSSVLVWFHFARVKGEGPPNYRTGRFQQASRLPVLLTDFSWRAQKGTLLPRLPPGLVFLLQVLTQKTCPPGTARSSFQAQASGSLSGFCRRNEWVCVYLSSPFTLMKSVYMWKCGECVCGSERERKRRGATPRASVAPASTPFSGQPL